VGAIGIVWAAWNVSMQVGEPLCVLLSLILVWGVTRLEGIRFRDLGWGKPWLIFAGVGIMAAVQLVGWGIAWIPARVQLKSDIGNVLPMLFYFSWFHVMVAFWEEIVNRGLIARLLFKGLGPPLGSLLGAALFALLHLVGGKLLGHPTVLFADFLGGCLYMALYAGSGSVWLPMGAHWAWNVLANLATVTLVARAPLPINPHVFALILAVALAAFWASANSPWLAKKTDQATPARPA
jgi:membrane protease YdiL (CAAX protease family)